MLGKLSKLPMPLQDRVSGFNLRSTRDGDDMFAE
jgi:hypothetical protein